MSAVQKSHTMTRFIGCIDLHNGQVKQIVGGTLDTTEELKTNFVSNKPSSYYAKLYQQDNVTGTHVIKLGPNNDEAAKSALQTAPGFLQVGGGINIENAQEWLSYGASKVIVTSWLFPDGKFSLQRLQQLAAKIGKDRLVIDLSCKRVADGWCVAMNKWRDLTDLVLSKEVFSMLSEYTNEFLVHAADVEGLCQGVDSELVAKLYEWNSDNSVVLVYAGGAKSVHDLEQVQELSKGRVDLTFGSSLDIFGGSLVNYSDCIEWNKAH